MNDRRSGGGNGDARAVLGESDIDGGEAEWGGLVGLSAGGEIGTPGVVSPLDRDK